MKGRRYVAAVIIAVAPSIPQLTGACSIPLMYGSWGRAPIAGDTSAPTNVEVDVLVDRGDEFGGCECGDACPQMTFLVFDVNATDDHTPAERIGYRFTVVDGEPPPSLYLRDDETYTTYRDTRRDYGFIGFMLGSHVGRFRFDIEIVAVDESGNESAPIVMTVDG